MVASNWMECIAGESAYEDVRKPGEGIVQASLTERSGVTALYATPNKKNSKAAKAKSNGGEQSSEHVVYAEVNKNRKHHKKNRKGETPFETGESENMSTAHYSHIF